MRDKVFKRIIILAMLLLPAEFSLGDSNVEVKIGNPSEQATSSNASDGLVQKKIEQFKKPEILNYFKTFTWRHPSQVIEPPREYIDVIKIGKPAVPYLLNLLNSNNGLLRLGAFLSL